MDCPFTKKELEKMYLEQFRSPAEIAKKAGVNHQTARRWIKNEGIPLRTFEGIDSQAERNKMLAKIRDQNRPEREREHRQRMTRLAIEGRKKKASQKKINAIRAEYKPFREGGQGMRALARKYKLTKEVVLRIINRTGVYADC